MRHRIGLKLAALVALTSFADVAFEPSRASAADASGTSQAVTWTCATSSCIWGASVTGPSLVWPAGTGATSVQAGYTTSAPVYLPASVAQGATITILSGNATVYAGAPASSSHRTLASLQPGQSHQIQGVDPDEVVSAFGIAPFTYQVTNLTTPPSPPPPVEPPPGTPSQAVTWTCATSSCIWGASVTGPSLVWPAGTGATSVQAGYTTSAPVYLPASVAQGATITILSGNATVYAGAPASSSHRTLASLQPGQSHQIQGVDPDEVVSAFGIAPFTYQVTNLTTPPSPPPPVEPPPGTPSQAVTWTCATSSCIWGASVTGPSLVWPAGTGATSVQAGYTTSAPVYLPASVAQGATITILSGNATVYAGAPASSSHRTLASLQPGQSHQIQGVDPDEVVSAFGIAPFTYQVTNLTTPPPVEPPCTDPVSCDVVDSLAAAWRCNIPGCTAADWTGSVIGWPAGTAFSTNGRTGERSRTVYGPSGSLLYPYMGAWADGCVVTAESGIVLIIEWQRGADVWRETLLSPGQSHVIDLVGSENGAMIESNSDSGTFSVSLSSCVPEPLGA